MGGLLKRGAPVAGERASRRARRTAIRRLLSRLVGTITALEKSELAAIPKAAWPNAGAHVQGPLPKAAQGRS